MQDKFENIWAFIEKFAIYIIGVPFAIMASLANLAVKKKFTLALVASKVCSGLFSGMLVFILLRPYAIDENYKAFASLIALYLGDSALLIMATRFFPSLFEVIQKSTDVKK